MPVYDQRRTVRRADLGRETVRRIQTEVIPRTERCIDRSTDSIDKCINLQLESTHRLLDERE